STVRMSPVQLLAASLRGSTSCASTTWPLRHTLQSRSMQQLRLSAFSPLPLGAASGLTAGAIASRLARRARVISFVKSCHSHPALQAALSQRERVDGSFTL